MMHVGRSIPRAFSIVMLLGSLALGGCAAQQLHREGLTLVEQGHIEEGLLRLSDASRANPGNLAYRTALLRSREQVVGRLLTAASSERAAERLDAAQLILVRVLRIDPENSRARLGLEELAMDRRHAQKVEQAQALIARNDLAAARELVKAVLGENPRQGRATMLQRQLDERLAKEFSPTPTLQAPVKKPVNLQFRDANLKMVFEALSRVSGINVLLDRDIRPDVKTSIFVKDASVEDVIDLILLQNQLEKKVVSDNTIFVYPNTPAKLREYQDLKIKSFHLVNADPKQMLAMIKALLKTKDVFIHERTNSLIMKDTPEAIRLAEKMLSDQDVSDPEVMLEVEVIEVAQSRLAELGIRYPDAFSLSTPLSAAPAAGAGSGTGLTLGQLRELSASSLLTTPLGVTLNLRLQDGAANVLASPRIRARNREKARILIGDRVPVITNSITPVATGTPVVTGSVQYLDVGIKLEVEPSVHADNEVGIRVALEVSSLVREISTASGTLAYQIGSRTASTTLRLKDGETQILAGLINDEDRKTANKLPGLGQLPVLGRLFSSHRDTMNKTEVILSITPRIVSLPRLPDAQELEYWAGTEAGLRTAPITVRPRGAVAVTSTGPVQPAGREATRPGGEPQRAAPATSPRSTDPAAPNTDFAVPADPPIAAPDPSRPPPVRRRGAAPSSGAAGEAPDAPIVPQPLAQPTTPGS